MKLGIVAAMHDEIADLIGDMQEQGGSGAALRRTIGMRDYYSGRIHDQECVVVLARIGKVAAAATTVTLIREFGVDQILFTGLAGGLAPHVDVGDVVVGNRLMQHDLDASPLFPRFEVPLLGEAEFAADGVLTSELENAVRDFLRGDLPGAVGVGTLAEFGVVHPRLHIGAIASGDQFISSPAQAAGIRALLPHALAVEMEGAAVAQVCHEYSVPFAVVRTVSDRADDTAHTDFNAFLEAVASKYSSGIVRRLLATRSAAPRQ